MRLSNAIYRVCLLAFRLTFGFSGSFAVCVVFAFWFFVVCAVLASGSSAVDGLWVWAILPVDAIPHHNYSIQHPKSFI